MKTPRSSRKGARIFFRVIARNMKNLIHAPSGGMIPASVQIIRLDGKGQPEWVRTDRLRFLVHNGIEVAVKHHTRPYRKYASYRSAEMQKPRTNIAGPTGTNFINW